MDKIFFILKKDGYFYLSLKKGIGEKTEKDIRYGNFDKFWSYFQCDELKEILLNAHFKVEELRIIEKKFDYQTHDALSAFC